MIQVICGTWQVTSSTKKKNVIKTQKTSFSLVQWFFVETTQDFFEFKYEKATISILTATVAGGVQLKMQQPLEKKKVQNII